MPHVAPYGTWTSPISAVDVARGETRLGWLRIVGDEVWWTEIRPEEGGRTALCRHRPDAGVEDVIPAGWSARNRVIEYGARPWIAVPGTDGSVLAVFTNWTDQRVYRCAPGSTPVPLTPEPTIEAGLRYGDFALAPGGTEVWCLRESATGPAPTDVVRDLVAVPLDGRAATDPDAVRVLGRSHHFMTGPKLSPDGRYAAWIGWNHPAMPWDGTELVVAELTGGLAENSQQTLTGQRVLAGGSSEAVAQVEWDGERLLAVTDPQGWWNLFEIPLDGSPARNLCPGAAESGGPMWQVGSRWFAPTGDGRHVLVHGVGSLGVGVLSPDGQLRKIDSRYTDWATVDATGDRLVGLAAGPYDRRTVVSVDLTDPELTVRSLRVTDPLDAAYLPAPEHREFPGPGGREVHAHVYPPRNPDFTAPEGELPPYVVFVHGGPTGRTPEVADLNIAYFTSRGVGVVDVQYGGSTGYGREYRERLREQWGVVDVEDCAAAARGLVAAGLADPDRLAIRGGSAGGWTSAASLVHEDLYRCGAIYYPILDLSGWRTGETHDFESQYLESIVGPWPATRTRYETRSPMNHPNRFTVPFLLLQGLEDAICPPIQCERLLETLKGSSVPHAYLTFEGEQHGFRKAATVVACLEAELSLYGQVFGFAPVGVPLLELS